MRVQEHMTIFAGIKLGMRPLLKRSHTERLHLNSHNSQKSKLVKSSKNVVSPTWRGGSTAPGHGRRSVHRRSPPCVDSEFDGACLGNVEDFSSPTFLKNVLEQPWHGAGFHRLATHPLSQQGHLWSSDRVVMQLQVWSFFYHPADSSAGSVGAPGELFKLSGRHLGRLQDPVGDLLVRGEVPQAISTVATSGPVVEDCWSVSLLLF